MSTDAVPQPAKPSRLIYVLPRIQLSGTAYRQERFSISKAMFLPDEPRSWGEVVQLPRPPWLDIYRHFPHLDTNTPPEPARGTLIISDDDEWLRTHISRVIGVAYVLSLERSDWQVPADAFQYSSFTATETPHDAVTFYTKSGCKFEHCTTLQLVPSLELRGVPTCVPVTLNDERHHELIRRFDSNPYDRLVVACFHLFRSQFDNPVVAPVEQDFAAYCACLEAALGVEGPGYSKELANKLVEIYGQCPDFQRWIKGLYSERSVFNHGISSEVTCDHSDDGIRVLAEFRQRSLSWDVLRKLCLDVIEDQLQESLASIQRKRARLLSPAQSLLRRFFSSEEVWADVARVFTQNQSVRIILELREQKHEDFLQLCRRYLDGHLWKAMVRKAEPKKVCDVLKAMAAIVGEYAKGIDDNEGQAAALDLFEAAKNADEERIGMWALKHAAWEKYWSPTDQQKIVRAVAVHTARFFRASP